MDAERGGEDVAVLFLLLLRLMRRRRRKECHSSEYGLAWKQGGRESEPHLMLDDLDDVPLVPGEAAGVVYSTLGMRQKTLMIHHDHFRPHHRRGCETMKNRTRREDPFVVWPLRRFVSHRM